MMIKRFFSKILRISKALLLFFEKDYPIISWVEKNNAPNKFSNEIPKVIWMYWDSTEKNHLVDFCIYNTKKECPDYEVILLNKKNVLEYITLPIFKEGLETAVIADYIRLSLLKQYGGIWMDASILLTENFNWFLEKMDNFENFVFYTDDCTTDLSNPIAENWFIAARKNSQFIKDWFDEFEKCCLSNDPNAYYADYKGSPIIQNIPRIDYLMCYISAAIVNSKKEYSILYANSGSVGHYYNYRFKWRSIYIAPKIFICNKRSIYTPKLVKFTSSTRYYPNLFIEKKYFTNRSLFGANLITFFNENSS